MDKRMYPLNEEGYVTTWLISGPLDTPIDPSTRTIADQNKYEWDQKMTVHNNDLKNAPEKIEVGADGIDGCPWHFYPNGPNCFVDVSRFYFTIYRCDFWIATSIVSPREQTVEADIWNYPSYDAWLNGGHISVCDKCQYAPMKQNRVTLSLKAGENLFFLRAQNACTRDTRNIVALSFPGKPDISLAYPGNDTAENEAKREALDWLYSISWNGEKLVAPCIAPDGAVLKINGHTVENGTDFDIGGNNRVTLRLDVCGMTLERKLELVERIVHTKKLEWSSPEEARAAFFESLAERTVLPDAKDAQHFYTTYIRLLKGYPLSDADVRIIRYALDEARVQKDCSDFRLSYILASVKKGLLPDYLVEEVKEAALGFSYWTDEKAIGAMCYGSENHALLFHTSQLLAGMLWQDEIFSCSGRTGREQMGVANQRISAWLEKIEKNGYSEFLSGSYSPLTAAAMLLVIDFADEELSARAVKLLDEMFYAFAHNTFDGIMYAPQGRVYRGVLTPWTAGTQTMIYFATGSGVPCGVGAYGSWLAPFADTKYKIPDDIEECIHKTGMYYGRAAGTRIQTYKGEHFMLTSLPIEMVNGECFGKFVPGAIGYQQHLSYATLGSNCFVYPQHPGGPYDGVAIRPGYWFGNGHFPAQKQWDNVLGQVFLIPDDHPIKFTHLYFPMRCFDEFEQDGSWLFGRKGEGYIAVWCSNELSLYDRDIAQGADWRASYGCAAYLTVCGDTELNGSFELFKKYSKELSPSFDREKLILTASGEKSVGGEFASGSLAKKTVF